MRPAPRAGVSKPQNAMPRPVKTGPLRAGVRPTADRRTRPVSARGHLLRGQAQGHRARGLAVQREEG